MIDSHDDQTSYTSTSSEDDSDDELMPVNRAYTDNINASPNPLGKLSHLYQNNEEPALSIRKLKKKKKMDETFINADDIVGDPCNQVLSKMSFNHETEMIGPYKYEMMLGSGNYALVSLFRDTRKGNREKGKHVVKSKIFNFEGNQDH